MAFDGTKLRTAREQMREHGRKVSQERFAELIGVSRRSPGRWENGVSEPRVHHLQAIARATGKPIDFFVSSEGDTTSEPFRDAA